MTIDIHSEKLLTATEAAKSLPNRPHKRTIKRWWSNGVRGIKLESVAIGDRRYTSVEALNRFHERRNKLGNPDIPQRLTPTQLRRKREKTRKSLAARGII